MSDETIKLYLRAEGSCTPPLLMNPPVDWSVKTFAKLGLRSVNGRVNGVPVITRWRDQASLEPSSKLAETACRPYDMLVISSEQSL